MSDVPNMLGGLKMTSKIEQLLLDKRGQFEDEHGDIIIWFQKDRDLDGWRVLMLDKRNRDRNIERVLSNTVIECANIDILWYTFTEMRNRLMV